MTDKQAGTIKEQGRPAVEADFSFPGFKNLNSTPIPDEFFDVLAVKLSEAELRVLLYIMRRTFGFKKKADAISLSQLTGGIRRRDGSMLDYGTGLSKPAVLKAVSGLQAKGIIMVEKRTGYDGRNEVNVYQLRFLDEQERGCKEDQKAISYPSRYSTNEYFDNEQTFSTAPDPRFAPARTKNPSVTSRASENSAGGYEQSWAGDKIRGGDNSKEEGQSAGVKPVDEGGKGRLPGEYGRGKVGLPGGVKPVDEGGKDRGVEGVKLVYQQHGILQHFRKQETVNQQHLLLQADGALALQESGKGELEPVEVEIDRDLLYINFRKLVTALMELGLSEKLAKELAYAYPEEYLWEKIELTRQQAGRDTHQRTVRNVTGYLRRAIEEDYQPRGKGTGKTSEGQTQETNRRFPVALALAKGSEEINTEGAAPLPPIYRPGGWSDAAERGTSCDEVFEGSPGSRGRPVRSSCGAGRGVAEKALTGLGSYNYTCDDEDESIQEGREGLEKDYGSSSGFLEGLWEQVCEDLAGRYRIGAALGLLEESRLWLEEEAGERRAVVVLRSAWQERELGLVARSAIGLALRQRLGPGYVLGFASD